MFDFAWWIPQFLTCPPVRSLPGPLRWLENGGGLDPITKRGRVLKNGNMARDVSTFFFGEAPIGSSPLWILLDDALFHPNFAIHISDISFVTTLRMK